MSHTPGPWHLRVSDNGTPHIEHGDCMRDDVGDLIHRVCVMPAEITMTFNSLANARLIAVAPDLLALLVESQENIGGDWRERRDAAIAKATGAA